MRKRILWLVVAGTVWGGCAGGDLETRTYEVQYLPSHEVRMLVEPYVFTDRDGRPGTLSSLDGALTVRETADNLERIERVLERFDRPRPSVMLHFQIIEANGAAESDPAIAAVERELRRLFRFDGYELVAETQMGGIQGTGFRQMIGGRADDQSEVVIGGEDPSLGFMIRGGVTEVRRGGEGATVTVDVGLHTARAGDILETTVTIPAGHSVVLGTAKAPGYEGALILVVRAEITERDAGAGQDTAAGA